jgi:hypothetical protein
MKIFKGPPLTWPKHRNAQRTIKSDEKVGEKQYFFQGTLYKT